MVSIRVSAAVNVLLGLMPYLDNFAHCGGIIMGFFMGLGLLVQKREDDRGDRLGKKCYQVGCIEAESVAFLFCFIAVSEYCFFVLVWVFDLIDASAAAAPRHLFVQALLFF